MSKDWRDFSSLSFILATEIAPHKKCLFSEFFWSLLLRIRTEYGEILCISPYSNQMWENMDQKNPKTDTFHAVLSSLFLGATQKFSFV